MSRRTKFQLRDALTVVVTTLLAAWYAAIVIGVPLPGPKKLISERFPCENCHCGCDSAEHCWRNCCCHTLAERLEWAEREGVEPPTFVRVEVELARKKPLSPCCAKRLAATGTSPSCCSAKSNGCCATREQTQSSESSYVLGWKAMACKGVGLQWTSAVPAIPIEPWQTPELPVRVEWLASMPRPALPSVYDAPSVPPPEHSLA